MAGRPGEIEVGAAESDGTLRLWKAREAVRQGELRLGAQAAVRTALEARATALTGWAAAALLALAAGGAAAADARAALAAIVAGSILFAAAALSVQAARPRDWGMAGYSPQAIQAAGLATELETLEAIADGISPAILKNNDRLERMGAAIRVSGGLLLAAPVAGAAVYAALRSASWWAR
jgi:hypothetical protein